MPERTEYEELASNILKAELKRKGVTYAQLAERLHDLGVNENKANIGNKLARGKFSAAFLFACMMAIGIRDLRI